MRTLLVMLALVTSCQAMDQSYMWWTTTPSESLVVDPSHPILILHPGGCLVGPLTVYRDKEVAFQLFAGVDYPRGCHFYGGPVGSDQN